MWEELIEIDEINIAGCRSVRPKLFNCLTTDAVEECFVCMCFALNRKKLEFPLNLKGLIQSNIVARKNRRKCFLVFYYHLITTLNRPLAVTLRIRINHFSLGLFQIIKCFIWQYAFLLNRLNSYKQCKILFFLLSSSILFCIFIFFFFERKEKQKLRKYNFKVSARSAQIF